MVTDAVITCAGAVIRRPSVDWRGERCGGKATSALYPVARVRTENEKRRA